MNVSERIEREKKADRQIIEIYEEYVKKVYNAHDKCTNESN